MKRFLILLITIPNFLFAETNEENILFKRMYENQEIMKKQMQDIIEENERLLKKIEKLESQQEIFYKETNEKISVIEKKTITNLNESKKLEAQVINQQENQDQKKNQAVDLIKKTDIEELETQENTKVDNVANIDLNTINGIEDIVNEIVKNNALSFTKVNLDLYKNIDEIELYRSAFTDLRNKKYKDALNKFTAFIKIHDASEFSSNATYWIGECLYAMENYEGALINFAYVIKNYPDGNKLGDSKLKIGYSLYNLQNWKLARLAFDNVISNYPNSTHSVLAEKKIQGMNLEGR
jgi:tol-pal system protein YbgF|tara:strand:- start:1146 stop:2030 length:885 start_codon:yes stop_codon:yes gene_type:complete